MDLLTPGNILIGLAGLFVLIAIFSGLFTVQTAQAAVIQRLGKFQGIAYPGLNFKLPFIDHIIARVDLRVQQVNVTVETKTKDNVFVKIPVAIQYQVVPEKVMESVYKLSNHQQQIASYVFNVILGHVPKMTLDDAFINQAQIAVDLKDELDKQMEPYGYSIAKALITDIEPDEKVKSAMNDINASQREQVAAQARGEADKILVVKKAEAEAESKKLQGEGIANQRRAIIDGLKDSVKEFGDATGVSTNEVLTLVLLTQYFDAMRDIGQNSNTILFPHSPSSVGDLFGQLRNTIVTSDLAVGSGGGGPNRSASSTSAGR